MVQRKEEDGVGWATGRGERRSRGEEEGLTGGAGLAVTRGARPTRQREKEREGRGERGADGPAHPGLAEGEGEVG